MFDIRSVFVVMVTTNLVLAFSFWIGAGRRPQGGLGSWTLSLLALAAALMLLAARGMVPDWESVVVANGFVGLSFSLAASAILTFRGQKLPLFVHFVAAGAAAFAVGSLLHDAEARRVASNIVFAVGQAILFALACKPVEGVKAGTRGLFLVSFALGATSFLVRAFAPLQSGVAAEDFLAPTAVQASTLLLSYTVILLSSVSFLLMQKERSDHLAQQLASLDPLTGAFNRRTFMQLANKELSRARRTDAPLSLILLDLDHFKSVNDNYGHLAGDRVLQLFAGVVREQLRKEDVLVRYGGEEFCLLLPDVPGPGAVVLAGRICKAVSSTPFRVDGMEIAVTTSAGVAARVDEGPDDLDDIIGRADEALYIAKNRGRNRVAAVSLGRSRAA